MDEYYIPMKSVDVITYPCHYPSQTTLVKGYEPLCKASCDNALSQTCKTNNVWPNYINESVEGSFAWRW